MQIWIQWKLPIKSRYKFGKFECDNKVKDCDLNTYYGGLLNNQPAVDSLIKDNYHLLNCHKCLTKDRIPFLFTNNDLEVKQFSLEFGNEKPAE